MKTLFLTVFLFATGFCNFAAAEVVIELHKPTPFVFNYDTVDARTGNPIKAPWLQTNAYVRNLTDQDLKLTSITFLLTATATGDQKTKVFHYPAPGSIIDSGLTQVFPLTVDDIIQNQFIYQGTATFAGTLTDKDGQSAPFSQTVIFQTQKF